jgi:hypothetical protein
MKPLPGPAASCVQAQSLNWAPGDPLVGAEPVGGGELGQRRRPPPGRRAGQLDPDLRQGDETPADPVAAVELIGLERWRPEPDYRPPRQWQRPQTWSESGF